MYDSQTPARHAEHDHAIAKMDACGFQWVENADGKRRELVAKPGRVLVLHWFDQAAACHSEETPAARFVAIVPHGPMVEVLIIEGAPSWEVLEAWHNQPTCRWTSSASTRGAGSPNPSA